MGHRSVPAPFLTKTYSLVDDGESDDIVSWNECGTAFVIWKTADFANDLLPSYFKHSNFSSFVRQLNTYGFRKTVPDKWEFANDNFKRGQKDLLIHIHRRKNAPTAAKTAPAVDAGPVADNTTSAANYGEDLGSTSSKSPSSTDTQASAQLADLSGENEKLKRHNQILSCELARSKRQCNELIAFLTRCVKVAPEQIGRIMNLECNASCATPRAELAGGGVNSDCGDGDESDKCVKLFGVVVKKKRESDELSGPQKKEMKTGQQDL